jgi:cob(I)alamin adenosyltransferase
VAAALDRARAVVRRAERSAVAATRAGWLPGGSGVSPEGAASNVVPYLNRLADLVYTMARWQEGDFRPVRTSPPPTQGS